MELLTAPPSIWKTYQRILFAKRSPGFSPEQRLPALAMQLDGVRIDKTRLQRYNRACGHPGTDALLATYPQVLAFPLLMSMLAADEFPLPVLGLVHTKNTIRYLKPIAQDSLLTIVVKIGEQRLQEKGLEFDVLIDVSVAGELVWCATMSMLSRCKTEVAKTAKREHELQPIASNISFWPLGAGLGRRYGFASGDLNPIHLFALSAKLFGFKRAIAHGMWSKARSLAELSSLLPPCPYQVSVKFKTPIFLPNRVRFAHCRGDAELLFDLWNKDGSKPHLEGVIRSLAKSATITAAEE